MQDLSFFKPKGFSIALSNNNPYMTMDIEELQTTIQAAADGVRRVRIHKRDDKPWVHLCAQFNSGFGLTASQTLERAPFHHDPGPLGKQADGTYELAIFDYAGAERSPCRFTEHSDEGSFRRHGPVGAEEVIEAAADLSRMGAGTTANETARPVVSLEDYRSHGCRVFAGERRGRKVAQAIKEKRGSDVAIDVPDDVLYISTAFRHAFHDVLDISLPQTPNAPSHA
jgi:hypothetical protein